MEANPGWTSMDITYEFDVAPHLRRGRQFRAQRNRRYRELHEHDGRAAIFGGVLVSLLLIWALMAYGAYRLI
jgi:hypothetical protein